MKIRLLFPPETPAALIQQLIGPGDDDDNSRGAWVEITNDAGQIFGATASTPTDRSRNTRSKKPHLKA